MGRQMMTKFNSDLIRTTIEVPIFFMFFAFGLAEVTMSNFVLFRSCYADLGFDRADCELLGTGDANNMTAQIEAEVQPFANYILMVLQIVDLTVPIVLILFLGSWSDQHGRKPVLIFIVIGYCISGGLAILVILVESLSAWYLAIFTAVMALFGGTLPFISTAVCYLADVTTDTNRGFRMGILDAVILFGNLIGTFCSSYILSLGGYVTIFSVITGSFFLAFVYIVVVIQESRRVVKEKQESKLSVVSLKKFKEIVRTIFKRPSYLLTILIILGILTSTTIKIIINTDTVLYLFLRLKLNWDLEKYTIYKSVRDLLRVVASLGLISLLHNVLRIREAPMILIASVLPVAGTFLQAWAIADWHIYLAGVLRCPVGVLAPMIRSFLSKSVTKDETGKLFSVSVVLESLVLAGAVPLNTLVYNSTLDVNPGAYNFLTAGFFGVMILLVAAAMFIQKFGLKENTFIHQTSPPNSDTKEMKTLESQ